jgi:hypothetical protein
MPSALRCLALALSLLLSAPALALNTDGRYKSPFDPYNDPEGLNQGISGAPFGAHRQGSPSGACFGGGSTWQSTPVSYWGINVDAGTYGMQFANKDQWPRMALYNIPAGTTYLRPVNTPDYLTGAFGYYTVPAQSFSQQFEARGTSVTSVSCKFASQTYGIAVIHDGGLFGPQIGPARPLEGNYNNDSMACWSAGEVPTVPGQLYTVEFKKSDNSPLQLYYSRARCLMGEDFPGCKSWIAGVETSNPLRTIIGMDTDGITTTVNTSSANSQIAYDFVASVAGQTFTARGTSVIGAHFLAPGSNGGYEVGIFGAPGADGMGVTQIGPLKWVWQNNDRVVAVWFPGEVPVTAGQQYYLRIRSRSGAGFALYHVSNEYAGGTEYIGGTAKVYDLTATILEETSAGSATVQPVGFSGLPSVQRGQTSATISFSTPVASTAVIEYGQAPPYTATVAGASPQTGHAITLTGLSAATQYHFRIRASASGRRDSISRDFVFVTAPATPNMLTNPGFETGNTTGWATFGNVPPPVKSSDIGGLAPHSGSYFLGSAYGGGSAPWGGAYQRVSVDPARPVTFQGWLYTYQLFGFNADAEHMVLGQIGIDPAGGTDPNGASVRWSPLTSAQDWRAPVFESRYQDIALAVQPQGGHVTVFCRGGQPNLGSNPSIISYVIYGWDDMCLTQPPVTLSGVGDIRSRPDGTAVAIPDVIVTAAASEAGANYVQDPGRAAGVRCESPAAFPRGHRVTVQGTLATKPSGERYLQGAIITADASSGEAVSLGARNRSLGSLTLDGAGPGNVGLLVRAWGRVESQQANYFVLNDGSSPRGIKVSTASLTAPLPATPFVEVTGILQLEGTAPDGTPLLRPRSDADVTVH